MANTPNFLFAKAESIFLILIIPGSYKLNITKALKYIFYSSYMSIKKKKSNIKVRVEVKKFIKLNIFGQILGKEKDGYNKDRHLSEY